MYLPLAKKAKELGVRATLDHPLLELNKLLLDEMKELADLGVYVGTYCQPMIPSLYQPVADPMETIRTIKEIGPERCIIGSDFGQVLHMDAIDGMRVFIRALLGYGINTAVRHGDCVTETAGGCVERVAFGDGAGVFTGLGVVVLVGGILTLTLQPIRILVRADADSARLVIGGRF